MHYVVHTEDNEPPKVLFHTGEASKRQYQWSDPRTPPKGATVLNDKDDAARLRAFSQVEYPDVLIEVSAVH
jgi:hypothetical protein